MGPFTEFITAQLNTMFDVVGLERSAYRANDIVFTAIHQHKSGFAQLGLAGQEDLKGLEPLTRSFHQTQVVCCGPAAVDCASVKASQL